jgi:hypothetical protein
MHRENRPGEAASEHANPGAPRRAVPVISHHACGFSLCPAQ